jgi:hypothetical protein
MAPTVWPMNRSRRSRKVHGRAPEERCTVRTIDHRRRLSSFCARAYILIQPFGAKFSVLRRGSEKAGTDNNRVVRHIAAPLLSLDYYPCGLSTTFTLTSILDAARDATVTCHAAARTTHAARSIVSSIFSQDVRPSVRYVRGGHARDRSAEATEKTRGGSSGARSQGGSSTHARCTTAVQAG